MFESIRLGKGSLRLFSTERFFTSREGSCRPSRPVFYRFKKEISMRRLCILILAALIIIVSACSQKEDKNLVWIKGGTFKNTRSDFYKKNRTLSDFYIGRYEVTQKEWMEVMGSNPSQYKGDNLPVEMVSWYGCIEYCNKRSVKEGLKPYYHIDKNKTDPQNTDSIDDVKWLVTINAGANGYHLPTEAEWEYAAEGGQKSRNYKYSGSNNINDAAWYWQNSGDKHLTGLWDWSILVNNKNQTKPVGGKKPNELGIYDMSGNVREWCWDWHECNGPDDFQGRVWKGGGWIGGDFCCEPEFRANLQANGMGPDQGFRVCRNE
jgi:formylglycine-generating enzyme